MIAKQQQKKLTKVEVSADEGGEVLGETSLIPEHVTAEDLLRHYIEGSRGDN
jgi:hypothetical protein